MSAQLHTDMSIAAYHEAPGYSASVLKQYLRSPAHGIAAQKTYRQPTSAMQFGTLCHTIILEPECFDERYVVLEGKMDKRTKAYKELAEKHPEQEIIGIAEYEAAREIARLAHRNCDMIADIIYRGGFVEPSIFYEYDNVGLKSRPDLMLPDGGVIIDYKTSADASPHSFGNSTIKFGYDIQCAMQCKAFYELYGEPCLQYYYLVQEKEYPYATALYRATERYIEYGHERMEQAIEVVQSVNEDSLENGYWTGAHMLYPPLWAIGDDE